MNLFIPGIRYKKISEKETDQSKLLELGSHNNKTCAQNFFQKSLHPLVHTCTSSFTHLEPIIGSVGPSEYCRILDKGV